jgi:hypothetical protein
MKVILPFASVPLSHPPASDQPLGSRVGPHVNTLGVSAGGDSEEASGGLRLDVGLHSCGASAKIPFDFPIHT